MKSTTEMFCLCLAAMLLCTIVVAENAGNLAPGKRVIVEAHNCYPYHGLWENRIDKALEAEKPVGIELDLMWYVSPETGEGALVTAHDGPLTGQEPTLRAYFFDRVRPLIEATLKENEPSRWPLFVLNLNDIRTDSQDAYKAVWSLLVEHEDWICTTVKGAEPDPPVPFDIKPVLVLSDGGRLAMQTFYEEVPVGGKLRIFGQGSAEDKASNFNRWVNYSWKVVEGEGQMRAGEWTEEDAEQLRTLVQKAHQKGYWIRFYALNGHNAIEGARLGLNPGYNFGSLEAVQQRWTAAVNAGVDFIATDQIESASAWIQKKQ